MPGLNGFLNLLKPAGMTSSDAVVTIRRSLGRIKTGHAGTLDPEAAGVLPLMIGNAARLFDFLVEKEKTYVAQIAFGAQTDTQDAQGKVIRRSAVRVSREQFERVLPEFTGEILQVPPAYSAVKINGKAAYALARKGYAPTLEARKAHIAGIRLLDWNDDGARIEIRCGRGVYIRTLCNDIGERLGTLAYMRLLIRTRCGDFGIEDAVTLEQWNATEDKSACLIPMDQPIRYLPAVKFGQARIGAVLNGAAFAPCELAECPDEAQESPAVRIYCGETFAGIGRWDQETRMLRFRAMLL